MRYSLLPAWLPLLATTIATATTTSISLSDFSPKITVSLTPACNNVYNEVIPGCTAVDFISGTKCSKSCLQGLVQITTAVQDSCQSDVVSENSVIGLFRAGLGIQVLCDVAVVTTTAHGASAAPAPAPAPATESIGQSTMKVSSDAATTGSLLTDTSVPSAPSMTSVVSPPPISMTLGSVTSTPPASTPSTLSPSKSSTSTSSKTSSSSSALVSQKSGNTQSGGGSPFDITSNSRSLHETSVNLGAALSVVTLAMVLLLR